MKKEQKRILKYIILVSLLIVGLVIVYILASPPVSNIVDDETEGDIEVSVPEEVMPENMRLDERLRDLGLNEMSSLLANEGILTELETAETRFSILVPNNSVNDIVVEKYILSEEIYSHSLDFPYDVQNELGETMTINYLNGEVSINLDGKNINVIQPDLRFNNGSIFIIGSVL